MNEKYIFLGTIGISVLVVCLIYIIVLYSVRASIEQHFGNVTEENGLETDDDENTDDECETDTDKYMSRENFAVPPKPKTTKGGF